MKMSVEVGQLALGYLRGELELDWMWPSCVPKPRSERTPSTSCNREVHTCQFASFTV